MHYALAGVVTFVTVGLKGFQHKNVIGGHLRWIVMTSYAMAFCDVYLIGLIARSTWDIAFACGTGAAFGMAGAVLLHDRVFGK